MPYTPNTTWVDGSGGGTPVSAARLNNLESGVTGVALLTYSAYTPTWTSTGTAPAIGNATVIARYAQINKLIHCYGSIVFGSTSTFGTGTYTFALPVSASTNATNANTPGSAKLFDTSSNNFHTGVCDILTNTTMRFPYSATYLGTITVVGQTTPWTWANGDVINWNLVYEAA